MRKWFRLIVCVDVPVESDGTLKDAYSMLYERMRDKFSDDGWNWESSDEAYDPNGELVDIDMLNEARQQFFFERDAQ